MEITWQLMVGALGCGTAATLLKHFVLDRYFVLDRSRVRLRASVDSRSVVLYEPVIEFTLTNEGKDEVHVSGITVVRKMKGEVRHDLLLTEPSKGAKFRLPGLEEETFTATWEDIFPDDPNDPCRLDDVTEFYVENVATQKRWKLPEEDLEKIREGVRATMAYLREKTEWVMTCRTCEKKTSWMARPPEVNDRFIGRVRGAAPGWTEQAFPHQYFPMESTGLCPECTAKNSESDSSPKVAE